MYFMFSDNIDKIVEVGGNCDDTREELEARGECFVSVRYNPEHDTSPPMLDMWGHGVQGFRWDVPAGVEHVLVKVWGAAGGGGNGGSGTSSGGPGGFVSSLIDVEPGNKLIVTVGQGGKISDPRRILREGGPEGATRADISNPTLDPERAGDVARCL